MSTWNQDKFGVFDYESEDFITSECEITATGYVSRNEKGEVGLELGKRQKNLCKVFHADDDVFIKSMTQNPIWEKQGNDEANKRVSALKEPMYLIVGEMEAPYVLKLFDIIKFGRLAFKITHLSQEKQENILVKCQ